MNNLLLKKMKVLNEDCIYYLENLVSNSIDLPSVTLKKQKTNNKITKKNMKIFFKAVANGDYFTVSEFVNNNSEYARIISVASPIEDDGQSGLQIAFKSSRFEIAKLLIDKGADINFIDTTEIHPWTAPVLQDCIKATIYNSVPMLEYTKLFEFPFAILQLMLDKKANINSLDSYGNNCLHRALLDTRLKLETHSNILDFRKEILLVQIRKVFKALISAGADINLANEHRPSAESFMKELGLEKYNLW